MKRRNILKILAEHRSEIEARFYVASLSVFGSVARDEAAAGSDVEAVKNNPDKFPHDYMFEISESEFVDLRSKFSTTKFAKTRKEIS